MAQIKLFGFTFGKKEDEVNPAKVQAFTEKENLDGNVTLTQGAGAYGTTLDMEGAIKSEAELISRYREMAMYSECEYAVDDITNEAIVQVASANGPVDMALDRLKISDSIKTKINDEFEEVLRLLDFRNQAYEIFRRWYVDGDRSVKIHEIPRYTDADRR